MRNLLDISILYMLLNVIVSRNVVVKYNKNILSKLRL